MPSGVYVHVPFCAHRCTYCSFVTSTSREREDDYFLAVEAEARARFAEVAGVETVYFGGGTPSYVEPSRLGRILELLAPGGLPALVEVTAEGNPDDLGERRLEELAGIGVTRLSVGVQSLSDAELVLLERRHDAAGAAAALRRGVAVFSRVSADLMIGVPGQTRESLRKSLDGILETGVGHVSAYLLEIEKAPGLLTLRRDSPGLFPDDDELADRWEEVDARLTLAGLRRYELSNWARVGEEGLHNLKYWRSEPVLGLGLAAHSFDGSVRRANTASMDDYLARVARDGRAVVSEVRLRPDESLRERALLALRLAEGVSEPLLESAASTLGRSDRQRLGEAEEAGLLVRSGGRVRFSPRGVLLSNEVFSVLL